MLFRVLKVCVVLGVMAYAAKSMGISNDYRSSNGITSEDFSASQMERWQKRAGKIISIEYGLWYWPEAFGNTKISFKNRYGTVSRLTYNESEIDWSGCSGYLYYDVNEDMVNSDISPACLTKRSFRRSLTKLILNSAKQIQEKEKRVFEANSKAQQNLSTWAHD